jgi:hypothetical protein
MNFGAIILLLRICLGLFLFLIIFLMIYTYVKLSKKL